MQYLKIVYVLIMLPFSICTREELSGACFLVVLNLYKLMNTWRCYLLSLALYFGKLMTPVKIHTHCLKMRKHKGTLPPSNESVVA